ncbi:MAG: (2Fe-2S)-binding protein [Saprospiraceae bacterium]
MAKFTLKINQKNQEVDVDPEMPLLWVLRDELNLRGTKFGCGKALCGACTVHLNGVAIRSCVLPVAAAVGAEIRTIEGLSTDGSHPVQRAWMEMDVPQCGYCQAGQIMTAAAFLASNPSPKEEEIAAVMSGNLCRCGTYPRIKKAVTRAIQLSK